MVAFKHHTADAIKVQIKACVEENKCDMADFFHWTPDGAANGIKALKKLAVDSYDICTAHQLQRVVKVF